MADMSSTYLLGEESDCLGTGEEIGVRHPSKEREDLCVVLEEGGLLHVVKHTNVIKNLLAPLHWPSVGREVLNTDLGMIVPALLASVGLKMPRLDHEHVCSNIHQTSMKHCGALVRVVEANKEVL
jgi:hypothetical protein